MKEKKKVKKEVFEIEGFIDNPVYKKFQCTCSQDPNAIQQRFPFKPCLHCHCKESLDSIPRECFDEIYPILDKNGKPTGKTETKRITKIKIALRDKKTDEILAYSISSTNTF
jgi:hypothetical protein